MTPIFIFSLPRSGSTLLQRLLASHSDISTTSETWLLLPLFYSTKRQGVYAEYEQALSVNAIEDFITNLPGGVKTYNKAIANAATELYQKASPKDCRYFVDKTPRYHLIAEEIINAFPESKFIFLWRNPLAVASSMIETWAHGRWNLQYYKIDFYKGLQNLIECSKNHQDKIFTLQYEELVMNPENFLQNLCDYLDLDFEPNMLTAFANQNLQGRFGDKLGEKKYKSISSKSLDRWQEVLSNPLRKRWAKQYLEWLGREDLVHMGYELDDLKEKLYKNSANVNKLFSDFWRVTSGQVRLLVEPRIFLDKVQKEAWSELYPHR